LGAAIPGLAAVGILVMAGLQYHYEMCYTGKFPVAGYKEISSFISNRVDKTLEEEYRIVLLGELTARFDKYNSFHGVRSRKVRKPHLH